MEYIEGPDLSQSLSREDRDTGEILPEVPACGAGRPLCHRDLRGTRLSCPLPPPVVHNDIKPGNIIIDGHSGRAVLVDFGTAGTRYLRAAGQPDRKKESVYGTVDMQRPSSTRAARNRAPTSTPWRPPPTTS